MGVRQFVGRSVLLAAASLLALGCGDDSATGLRVDLRTDWVPGLEFDQVRVEVAGREETFDALEGAAYLRGVRVAEITGLSPGPQLVTTTLEGPAGEVARRAIRVELGDGVSSLTVVMARSCAGVVCAGELSECLGGRCVAPECGGDLGASCGGGCVTASDCPAASGCAEARCVESECLVALREAACGATEVCDPERGCVNIGGTDAGPSDGGPPDAGPPDMPETDMSHCGVPCSLPDPCQVGATECVDGETRCVEVDRLDDGTACGPGSVDRGACAFANTCSESGSRPVTTTEQVCRAGFCSSETTTTSEACARDTEREICGPATSCNDWRCAYDTQFGDAYCRGDGHEERRCTYPACASGTCSGSTARTETGAACTVMESREGDQCAMGFICCRGTVCTAC